MKDTPITRLSKQISSYIKPATRPLSGVDEYYQSHREVEGTTQTLAEDTEFNWLFGQGTLDEGFDQAIADLSKVDEDKE